LDRTRSRPLRGSIATVAGVGSLLVGLTAAGAPGASADNASLRKSNRSCRGIRVSAGASLQSAINRAPKGARLCLAAATYRTSSGITLKDRQKLVGVSPSRTVIKTSRASTIVYARPAAHVKIKRVSVTGATAGPHCRPNCGRGIAPGRNTTIVNVRVHHNKATGIGGSRGSLLIKNSEIDHNGHPDYYGCCASGIKTGTAFRIENSFVHDNVGVGIWCDVGCDGGRWTVLNNIVTDNTLGGIRYEISGAGGSALIRGNIVRRNNRRKAGGHGGIEINSSRNAIVARNRIGSNVGPGVIINGGRPPGVRNIVVRRNRLNNDSIHKCGGPVICRRNK
jgi:hypothetical protein